MESVFNIWLVPKTLIAFGQRDTLNSYEFNFLIEKTPTKNKWTKTSHDYLISTKS